MAYCAAFGSIAAAVVILLIIRQEGGDLTIGVVRGAAIWMSTLYSEQAIKQDGQQGCVASKPVVSAEQSPAAGQLQ